MLLSRYAVVTTFCAATVTLAGCTGDNPAQNNNPVTGTPGGGVAITTPFDDLAKSASSLQQAAGMAAGAKAPGLTTVAPLQQTGAGYRVNALSGTTLPADDSETEGLFTTYFHYTEAQKGTDDSSGAEVYATAANYDTLDQDEQNVESGNNVRVLGYKMTKDDNGNDIYVVAVSEARKATTSKRRAPGTYGLTGVVALHEQIDYLQLSASYLPLSGGASSSIKVTYTKLYKPSSSSGTLANKIAHRGAKVSESIALQGSLASGESLDLEAKHAGTDTEPTRAASASVDLGGGKGSVFFWSNLTLKQSQPEAFPSAITGRVSVVRLDATKNSYGGLVVESFTPKATAMAIDTSGELRNPAGTKVGTFTGTIDLKSNQWMGVYQQDGQATKSIDLSGLLSQLW